MLIWKRRLLKEQQGISKRRLLKMGETHNYGKKTSEKEVKSETLQMKRYLHR